MRLTASTDSDAVAAHVIGGDRRAALRTAEERSDRLQRNARIRTGRWDLELGIETDHPPATIERSESDHRVVVSGDHVPQPVTDYPPREWDLLVQKVWVMHEVGHLRYSALGDLDDRLEGVPDGWRGVAGRIWNAFEDGVIEAATRDRWPNYGRWFAQVRANLLAARGPGISDPNGGTVYPMVDAIVIGVLDGMVYDSGRYARLLDPADDGHHFHCDADRERFESQIRDTVAGTVEEVWSIPDPRERNRRTVDFTQAVRPAIEGARADGRAQIEADLGDAWGMPDDGMATRGSVATDPDPISLLQSGHGQPEIESGVGDRESGHDAYESGDRDLPTAGDAADTDPDLEAVLTEAVEDQERAVTADQDEAVQNLQEFQEAVAAAEGDLESQGVVIPTDDPEPDEDTVAAALADGERLAKVLRNRFQKRRRRQLDRNLRRGRLDPAALHRHALGETRLKLRRETPDDVDYRCLFVLDRSGSMRPHIRVAERAMGMLVVALESVDVEVDVLELLDKEVRLAKPADREAGRAAGRLFHGQATGGTPLTDTLHIARERLKREQGRRFLFVVTDGLPADPDRYREALDRFPVPVVGVNLNTDRAAGTREFHRQVTVEPETDQLRRALRQLVQEVLFE